MQNKTDHNSVIQDVLKRYPDAGRDQLIPILQDVQEADGYVSEAAVRAIGQHLKVSANKIYGVATFYNQFRFHPIGRFHVQVCRGTACHVQGSARIGEQLQRHLGVSEGETTSDGVFSLQYVACLGCCSLAPVMMVDGEVHGRLTPEKAVDVLESYRTRD